MAEIKTIVSDNVTMIKVIGIPTVYELMTCLKEFYNGYPTKFVVWDLSACSLAQVTADDLRQIVSFVRSYANTRLEDKTAIVAHHTPWNTASAECSMLLPKYNIYHLSYKYSGTSLMLLSGSKWLNCRLLNKELN